MFDFLAVQTTSPHPSFATIIYTVLLAFLLSTLIAVTYEKTFRGLSYSRNFVQALILAAIVAATVMHAIGDSLARGLGMLGALAIIRFRINIRDPRDIIFMFASLAAGIASGVCGYAIAVVGTFFFCAVAVVLYFSPFGQASYFDGMLRFNIENDAASKKLLEQVGSKFCKVFALVTLREMAQGNRLEYAYHVKLRKGMSNADFIEELKTIESIKGVRLLLQETTVEL
jgi:uncharacterized membrane protein YhiD involved in acid resistance